MPTRASSLFDELETKLTAIYSTSTEPITFGRGPGSLGSSTDSPRIVWVVTGAKPLPPTKQRTNPRSLLTRLVSVEAHCWGRDFDKTEQLVHDVLTELHYAAWGSYELVGEDWPKDDNLGARRKAIVTFAVQVPITSVTKPTVIPTKVEKDAAGATSGDGELVWGEP